MAKKRAADVSPAPKFFVRPSVEGGRAETRLADVPQVDPLQVRGFRRPPEEIPQPSADEQILDLFGRTVQQLEQDIARQKRILEISSGYTGGEGLALKLARLRANLEVDERQLLEMIERADQREITLPPVLPIEKYFTDEPEDFWTVNRDAIVDPLD